VTPDQRAGGSRFSTTKVALLLGAVTLMIALLTPEPPGKSEGGLSTFSTAPGGAGIVYDLAKRFGWHTERRITPLDSAHSRGDARPTVQVVLAPREPLGAHEIHNLLENVRRGGGLILSLDGDDALRDSLGLAIGSRAQLLSVDSDSSCATIKATPADIFTLPPAVREVSWARHAPGRVEPLVKAGPDRIQITAGAGFPMGRGRVAVVGASDVFANSAVRVCRIGADVAVMRLVEYTRPPSGVTPVLVFDEFHHGFGVHGGSLTASVSYLAHTRTGHLLAQALAAGLLLLLALAPRPLVPRDDTHVVRRSPLEHAAALGRAYEDVGATRTATTALLGGLRRRTRGIVPIPASASDDEFLAGVVRRIPALAPSVDVVKRARSAETPKREFVAVGQALSDIEEQLQTTPSTRS
jgi:hypothetical protein